jgi:hypothetical protein
MQAAGASWPAKHNWRYIGRESPPKRAVAERVCDFDEIYGLFDEATARAQASRCINCPDPPCVVRAVRDSRRAAAGVHKYLSSRKRAEHVLPMGNKCLNPA